jgi:ABC-type glycerol-3-phosphate transport system substrate-binding protein/DNA-binding transcriptional regulator YhcF (GntR family)
VLIYSDRVIDPGQPLPVYAQLKTLLLEEIGRGAFGHDGRLPTEHELCERYQISRTPVHRALAELADQGVVLRHRRRGTFVNPHWMKHDRPRTELRVVVPEGPWEGLVRDACAPDMTLNVATVALEDLRNVLVRAVAEGRAPDVALLDSVWVAELAASGFLLELDELDPDRFTAEYLADVPHPFRAAHVYGGRCFAVQAEADVAGLWYSRAQFEAHELHPPGTWDELLEICRVLRARGTERPLAMPAGSAGGEATAYCLLALMATNGATAIDHDEVTVGSSATVECLELVRALVDAGALDVKAVQYEHDRAPHLLAHGDAVMSFGGSHELRTLARATGTTVEQAWDQFGFVRPPQGPRGGASTLTGGMVHGIFRQAQQPRLAAQLLHRLCSTEAQAHMSRETGQLSCRRSAAETAAQQSEFLRSTGAMLDGAAVRPVTTSYAQVSVQLQAMLESVVVGRQAPRAAAARAEELVSVVTGLPPRLAE